jgi:DNA polymerase III delta subunit
VTQYTAILDLSQTDTGTTGTLFFSQWLQMNGVRMATDAINTLVSCVTDAFKAADSTANIKAAAR